ncbi:Low-density lipoprotein receptor-related protein 1-like 3, partial [Homarus americanus]
FKEKDTVVDDGGTTARGSSGGHNSPTIVVGARRGSGGVVCVGGVDRGTLEAQVARAAIWRRTLGAEVLLQASGCRGQHPVEAPYLMMERQWTVAGNASLGSYSLEELCLSEQRPVVVQPAGSYSRHGIVCHALDGALMSSADLTPSTMLLARGANDSCVGPGGLVTWLSGGKLDKGAAMKVTAEDECPAQGTEGGMFAACVRQLQCSLCQVPLTVMYNLYGHDGRLFDHNYYIDTQAGQLVFRGVGGSEIVSAGGGWVLRSTLHQMEWVLEEGPVPVGRQQWGAGARKVVLTLTTCRTSQFACDDGQCVPQTSRCDEIFHCNDRSDEANCRVVDRAPGYDPYYPPPPRPDEITPMDLIYHVDVYSMDDLTTEGGVATMNVGMTLKWFDPRLKFLNLKPKVKNYFLCDLVWTPSVRAVSGHGEGTVLETTDYEKFCYAYADTTSERPLEDSFMSHQADGTSHAILNYVGVVASVPCHFQLQMYPFDFQLCNISFMLMNAPWTRIFR